MVLPAQIASGCEAGLRADLSVLVSHGKQRSPLNLVASRSF